MLLAGAAAMLCLPGLAKVSPSQYLQLREDGFGAAQGTIVSAAADALGNVGLEFSEGAGPLSDLVHKGRVLGDEIEALRRQLDKAYDDRGPDAEANRQRIRDEAKAKSDELDAIDRQLAEQFPAYAELTRPKPLSSREVQALLEPDEAMLLIVPGSDATYLFAVTKDKFDWARSSLKESDMIDAVTGLRDSLTAPGVRGNVPVLHAPADASPQISPEKPFDRKLAYRLYREIVAPLEPLFRDKRVLFTLTTGALQSLPPAVLVTDDPQGTADNDLAAIRATHWLVDRYALVTLPAVSSLLTLRCYALRDPAQRHAGCPAAGRAEILAAPKATLAFAGVGAPVLKGKPPAAANGYTVMATRGPEGFGTYSRGEIADVEALRTRLPTLAYAEAELKGLEREFHPDSLLLIRDHATETEVKTNPKVSSARVLVFSTHALIADEVGAIGEPGLVLTPPKVGTREDDGLLTASEVAKLHLAAEFVVLSACNTARADGKLGADGLSGLARAFFYAGARALLVSHWSVNDKATMELMNATFEALKKNPQGGRAVAFQSAVEAMKQNYQFVEPKFWAPFVLVGDTAAK